MSRIIFHVDFDSFYAQLEELRRPEIKGKPVVVCVYSGRENDSGAVAAANYPARDLGIRSGMPNSRAVALGKDKAVFVPIDKPHYKAVSDKVMEFLRAEAGGKFEQISIDEAYMDFTGTIKDMQTARARAISIKKGVMNAGGITCSIGIGPNKIIAKMASKEEKPDGLTAVTEGNAKGFLFPKPARRLHGVGPKALVEFVKLGINTIGDLAAYDLEKLTGCFGRAKATMLWERANGIDDSLVEDSDRQAISNIATLPENTRDYEKIGTLLESLCEKVQSRIAELGMSFRTVTVTAISPDLEIRTRSRTLNYPSGSLQDIKETAHSLAREFLKDNPEAVLKRVGVGVSGLEAEKGQKTLSAFVGNQ